MEKRTAKILCFGDSNTYGFNPTDGSRYDKQTRWSGILSELLKDDFEIIEAGCNNRNCFAKNPLGEELIGVKAVKKYLKTKPDLVLLALGINDLQKFYRPASEDINKGVRELIDIVQKELPNSKIVLISPSVLKNEVLTGFFAFQFDEISIQKSKEIAAIYEKAANDMKVYFLNFDKIADVSKEDGLHYTPEGHLKIAQALREFILALFKNSSNLSA
ncbi:MAG: GDSL-type esterase/lipase family protein [bacterium]|nr:GDSL-type esterase/lipase family protein [bacterium]